MKNEITLNLRRYPVKVRDDRSGDARDSYITLDKSQFQACQLVGQSSTDLIYRLYNRKGYTVLEIGKPIKLPVTVDLDKLWRRYTDEQEDRAKEAWLATAPLGRTEGAQP